MLLVSTFLLVMGVIDYLGEDGAFGQSVYAKVGSMAMVSIIYYLMFRQMAIRVYGQHILYHNPLPKKGGLRFASDSNAGVFSHFMSGQLFVAMLFLSRLAPKGLCDAAEALGLHRQRVSDMDAS